MQTITMRDFALLCRNDPMILSQVLAMPDTISLERVFELAASNGYAIVLDENGQDAGNHTPGVSALRVQDRHRAWQIWLCTWTGIGEGGAKPLSPRLP